jgi:RecA-family ATPase
VYGEANCGKSFWLLDLAFNIAPGDPWRGRRTRRGLVLYVAGESADSVNERVAAYRKEHPDVAGGLPFTVIREAVDLLDEESVQKLIRTISFAESECGEKATLIVIDTFARSIPGGNENDARDVGRAVTAADHIRTATGGVVGFIHHAGKDTSKGARGSSALRAAVDTEILIEGQTGKRTVTVTKQRDLPIGDRFAFELHQVVLGRDEDDEAITSCVVDQAEVPDGPAVKKIKGANKVKLLAALKEWESANPDKEIISSIELARIAKAQGLDRHRKSEAVRGLEKDGVLVPSAFGHRLVLEGFST